MSTIEETRGLNNAAQAAARRCAGSIPVAIGFAILIFSMALSQFVIIGLLGFAIIPVGFGALLTGVICARNGSASTMRQATGLLLLILSIAALVAVVFSSVSLAHAAATHNPRSKFPYPGSTAWLLNVASWLIPTALWWCGLKTGSHWSPWARCLSSLGVLFTAPASMILFSLFATVLPTGA